MTLAFADTSTSVCERSGMTTTSLVPKTCSVGVVYGGSNIGAQVMSSGLNPDTATQNFL